MKLQQHPELLDRLAASYALGTLRGGARRRFEAMAREQAPVRAAALMWQSRLSSMNELMPATQPAPAVWTRIDNLVQAAQIQQAQQAQRAQQADKIPPPAGATAPGLSAWLQSLTVWRAASAAAFFAAVLSVSTSIGMHQHLRGQVVQLQAQLEAHPPVSYVAVLADKQSAASMLVTFDPQSKSLTLQRVGDYRESSDRSLQLWALPPAGGPRSLGVLPTEKLLHLTAAEADVKEVPTLAISLEPKGGVPGATGPTGPVLFKGALIRRL